MLGITGPRRHLLQLKVAICAIGPQLHGRLKSSGSHGQAVVWWGGVVTKTMIRLCFATIYNSLSESIGRDRKSMGLCAFRRVSHHSQKLDYT